MHRAKQLVITMVLSGLLTIALPGYGSAQVSTQKAAQTNCWDCNTQMGTCQGGLEYGAPTCQSEYDGQYYWCVVVDYGSCGVAANFLGPDGSVSYASQTTDESSTVRRECDGAILHRQADEMTKLAALERLRMVRI